MNEELHICEQCGEDFVRHVGSSETLCYDCDFQGYMVEFHDNVRINQ